MDAPIIYLDGCLWKELENALYKSWELAVFGARRDLGAGSALALHILAEPGGGKVQGDAGPGPEALCCPFLAPPLLEEAPLRETGSGEFHMAIATKERSASPL